MSEIGIITIPRADNYGSVLQAYGIQQFVNEINPDNELIDYVAPFLVGRYKLWDIRTDNFKVLVKSLIRNCLTYNAKKKKKRKYNDFRKLMHFSERTVYSASEINKYKFYIAGSDQIWNTRITNSNSTFFLDFVDEIKSKIAFSVSLGYTDRSKDEILFYRRMVNSFKWLGVREENDVDFIKDISAEESVVDYIIDPTLLIPENKWKSLIKERLLKKDYILIYSFGNDLKVIERAKLISKKEGLPVYIIADEWKKKNSDGFINLSGIGPLDFVNLIANAKYVITNSFHGTAFSIIFKKQFTVVPYKGTENRIVSLLKLLKLESGIYSSNINNFIDYSGVDNILQFERNKAKTFLKNAIGEF